MVNSIYISFDIMKLNKLHLNTYIYFLFDQKRH